MRGGRLVWAALVVAAVTTLVLGTGGFSVATLDRGVTMAVSDHDHALVSVWDPGGDSPEPPRYAGEDPVTSNDTTVRVLVIENRFTDETLDVAVTERPESPVAVEGSHDGLGPGDVAPITAEVECNGHEGRVDALLTVEATAVGGGFEGEIDYDASVVCPGPTAGQAASGASG
jgi:hypothetical protein